MDVFRQATGTVTLYGSLTDALNSQPALVAGDVVAVRGIVDATLGVPIAYSETTTNESFPLVVPSGVTVRTQGADPVYVATVDSGPVTLMVVDPSGGAPAPTTRVEGLRFQGPDYVHAGADLREDEEDVEGVPRPVMPTHDRDLGGEEG